MSRWFRFYDDALNDPKVQALPGDLFKSWVNLMCVASKNNGRIPSLAEAAFGLRMTESKAAVVVTTLATKKLLDKVEGGYFEPHNWSERQFKSDTSADRMRAKRQRDKNVTRNALRDGECDVTRDGESTVTVTPIVTRSEQSRTDTEGETDSEPSSLLPSPVEIINISCEAKSEKRSPPRNGLKSNDWIYCEKGTPEWASYAADFVAVHGFEPNANPDNGRWFKYMGEATVVAIAKRG